MLLSILASAIGCFVALICFTFFMYAIADFLEKDYYDKEHY